MCALDANLFFLQESGGSLDSCGIPTGQKSISSIHHMTGKGQEKKIIKKINGSGRDRKHDNNRSVFIYEYEI